MERIRGRVLKYQGADDVDTDVIWPGKYTYVSMSRDEMAQHAMETFDPMFRSKLRGRDVLVVGRNFGCGSSREQASECLEAAGVRAVIARSFSRIFFRNSIHIGLPVIASEELCEAISDGEMVDIDLTRGEIRHARGTVTVPKFPPFLMEILQAGGLIPHLRRRAGHLG